MTQKLILKWDNHVNVMNEFKNFLSFGTMVDVTLACDGQSLKAHKIVLSACSSFFKSLFLENTCSHPIVILKDVKYAELKAIVDFMYCGELSVEADQLTGLVKIAQTLKVNGLGDVEAQNDDFCYESEYYSGDESENLSHDESITDSVCTVDVQNGSLKENLDYLMDQNDLVDSSDVVILESPEIKEEVVFDLKDNSVPSSTSVMNVNSSCMTSFKSGDIVPVLEEQTTIPKESIQPPQPMKLFKNHSKNMPALNTTSAQVSPNRGMFKNNPENVPTLTTSASTHMSLEQPFQSSIMSSNELFQNHSKNTSVVSARSIHTSLEQFYPSSVQSNMETSQRHSNVPSFPLKTSIHVSHKQLFHAPEQSEMEFYQNRSDNINNLCSVTSTIASGRQSLQSFAQSNMELSKSNHSGNSSAVISSESTHASPVCTSVQSNMQPHQNQSNNMSKIPPKISSYAPPRKKFQASAKSDMKLHQNHSDNVNDLSSATSSVISGRQLFQSSKQSNKELPKLNHSRNLITVHSSELTHSLPVHSSQSSVQSNMDHNQSHNVTELPSKISTSVPPKQLFVASAQSGQKEHQKHSDNKHSLSLGKSTAVLQGQSRLQAQSSRCSTQSVIQSSESNHSKNLSTLVSVVSRHAQSNTKASDNIELPKLNHSGNLIAVQSSELTHSLPVHSSQSSVQSNMELHHNQSHNTTELPSKISTSVPPKRLFVASAQSSLKEHQKHSDNTHSLSLGKSTIVLQEQSSHCSTQSVIQSPESNHSKNLSTSVSVVSRHAQSNIKASDKNLSSSCTVSALSRHGSSCTKGVDSKQSSNSSVSAQSRHGSLCTKGADNKQSSSFSASAKRKKKKLIKRPSSMCRNQPLKKKKNEKEMYRLPSLRKPEVVIIGWSDKVEARQNHKRPEVSERKSMMNEGWSDKLEARDGHRKPAVSGRKSVVNEDWSDKLEDRVGHRRPEVSERKSMMNEDWSDKLEARQNHRRPDVSERKSMMNESECHLGRDRYNIRILRRSQRNCSRKIQYNEDMNYSENESDMP